MKCKSTALYACVILLIWQVDGLQALDLAAVTRSGNTFDIQEVDTRARSVSVVIKGAIATLDDPVVDIRGLDGLKELIDLRFYHVPQIADFRFLENLTQLEILVVSFARVRTVDFLTAMPKMRVMVLEFCDDWENDDPLPFLAEPLDLSSNRYIEYLGFRVCGLTSLPAFLSIPPSLKVLDLSYNEIIIDDSDRTALDGLRSIDMIFIGGNSVDPKILSDYPNLVLDVPEPTLLEQVR